MKYKLWFKSGQPQRTAKSMKEALLTARAILHANRVYRGAEYITDEPNGDDRHTVEALDIWTSRKAAKSEQGVTADCVITW